MKVSWYMWHASVSARSVGQGSAVLQLLWLLSSVRFAVKVKSGRGWHGSWVPVCFMFIQGDIDRRPGVISKTN
jgi:hypothetical protein